MTHTFQITLTEEQLAELQQLQPDLGASDLQGVIRKSLYLARMLARVATGETGILVSRGEDGALRTTRMARLDHEALH